jgi:hypothetical protein
VDEVYVITNKGRAVVHLMDAAVYLDRGQGYHAKGAVLAALECLLAYEEDADADDSAGPEAEGLGHRAVLHGPG